jgi:DNA-directed RNA polymerase subunit RPC12/RpoP
MTNKEIAERIIDNTCKNRVFCELYPDVCQKEKCDIYLVINTFLNTPDIDTPDLQQGEWIEIEDYNGDIHYQCDQCGNEFILIDGTPKENNYNFCPNCGAKMGGDEI